MNKFTANLLRVLAIALTASAYSPAWASSGELNVTCEGVRKDLGVHSHDLIEAAVSDDKEKLLTIRVTQKDSIVAIKTQLPFFDGAEFLFEEVDAGQRGLYFKNSDEELFVVLLIEPNESILYYVTQPFESYSNKTWTGVTHLSLKCVPSNPVS